MSTMPPIVPIVGLTDAQDANAPEPESERAERLKAKKAERLLEGDPLPHIPEDEFPENSIELAQEVNKRRSKGE